jgi:uncharacterized membrane protein
MKKQNIYIILVIAILLLPAIFYVVTFHKSPIGNTPDWSNFGNFYGGILGPIITAITTLLLIRITFQISQNEETRQNELILSEYRQNIISKLVDYQQSLNNIKSQFLVKKLLIESQINKNKNEYNNMSFWDKGSPEVQKSQQDKKFEINLSIKLFYADILYNISEIRAFFDNFATSQSLLFSNNYLNINDLTILNSELLIIEDFLKSQLLEIQISIPQNINNIESEISKIIVKIADSSRKSINQ